MKKANTQRINSIFTSLTRAIQQKQDHFTVTPFTDLVHILDLLVESNVISGFVPCEFKNKKFYKIFIRYDSLGNHWLNSIEYYSTPGNRRFIRLLDLKKAEEWTRLSRFGLLRTRLGFLTLKACVKFKIGGELLILFK